MKKLISNILTGVVGLSAASCLWSCSAESPFENEGQGVIQLRTVVNSITTRAEEDPQKSLEEKCVVYISGKDGLVYKRQGLQNVDAQITLQTGSYAAEAWTGDSVTASFDKKFYRGYQSFDVSKGSTSNVVLNCKIANVVVAINTATINPSLMKDDYVITVRNTRGQLSFTKDNAVDGKAYFMMPNGDDALEYTITGTRKDGDPFTKTGRIEDVKRAHLYILNFEYNPGSQEDPDSGAVFIKINIKEEEVTKDNVTIFSRPTVTGVEFDLNEQLHFINDEDIPDEVSVRICGDGLSDIELSHDCCAWKEILDLDASNESLIDSEQPINFGNLNPEGPVAQLCKEKGIEYIPPRYNEETKIETAHLNFSKQVFQRLARNDQQHVFRLRVTDNHAQETEASLRIARTEAAIEIADPIELDRLEAGDWHNIKAYSTSIPYSLAKEYEGTPGVEYSKADEDNWTFVAAVTPSATPRHTMRQVSAKPLVTLTGLQPGTTYKYRACCGDFRSDIEMTFTTETVFSIPNASMEEWSDFSENSKVLLPGAGGERTFWDSGNHGSATISITLTQGSSDMAHSGSLSAKLRSQFVGLGGFAGKFAAGNLFAGTYLETQGTDGRLEFGRPYNGSHPKALRVWVNYRPGTVEKSGAKAGYLAQGDIDEGQIYVALSTEAVEVRTKSSNQKLFNKDEEIILAYGQYTFDKVSYGPDGQLQELIIPIEYFTRADSAAPTHLVIVCSASKYGDYFCGGEGSTMYLDDFELIYE